MERPEDTIFLMFNFFRIVKCRKTNDDDDDDDDDHDHCVCFLLCTSFLVATKR